MNADAPGQLLGYTLQFPRALCKLLKVDEEHIVCVENFGDVSVLQGNSVIESEEDKSSLHNNPITDKSENLWKTLFNWVELVRLGHIEPRNCSFFLYTNKSGRKGLAHKFKNVQTEAQAIEAIEEAKGVLSGIANDHAAAPYFAHVTEEHSNILVEILQRFDLEVGTATAEKEVIKLIKNQLLVEEIHYQNYLFDSFLGWLTKTLCKRIETEGRAWVSKGEFLAAAKAPLEKVRTKQLIDFTSQSEDLSDLSSFNGELPTYLDQLVEIGLDDDDLIEAANAKIRAEINRDRWIERGMINDQSAQEFETNLTSFWKNNSRSVQLSNSSLPAPAIGEISFRNCMVRQETISGITPPPSTVSGTYHLLADDPVSLGWHPDWKRKFGKRGGNS